ncbi:MAG: glutamate 5-kinase [Alphaproteobacteria bacterium]|nr:glutamate 5-kinase [Alphaproteobacteria bacterium]
MTSPSATSPLGAARRVVVKVGSALIADATTGRAKSAWLEDLAADLADLRARGVQVLVVSSGAVALGRGALGLKGKLRLEEKQAAAAAGQSRLMRAWEEALAPYGAPVAQALLTPDDTENRRRWLNGRATLETLLTLGAVPVINENDTVATIEIRYGDNDRLAARVAQMASADALVLLSDVDGLYTADPRNDPNAEHLPEIRAITPAIEAMAGGANAQAGVGSGGMRTKVEAAKIATAAGCAVAVTRGDVERPLARLAGGGRATWFLPADDAPAAYKAWIAGALAPAGAVTVDTGALAALRRGASLLPAGVRAVAGAFEKGDAVRILGPDGAEIGRGLARYDSTDAAKIAGLRSVEIEAVLGYMDGATLIHADDLALTARFEDRP